MYNENVKRKFLDDRSMSSSTLFDYEALFNAMERYEESLSRDICTMDTKDLSDTIDNITGSNLRGKKTKISMLKAYIQWCISERIEGANDNISVIDIGVGKTPNRTVKSPQHLNEYLNKVFNPVEDHTVDNTYRCVLWLSYSGIPEDSITEITEDNIDLDNMVINYGGNKYIIYKEAIDSIKSCIEDKYFVYKHPRYADTTKFRVSGDDIVRGFSHLTKRSARTLIARKIRQAIEAGKTDIELSYYRTMVSGFFYRTYVKEKAGCKINFEEEAIGYMNAKLSNLSEKNVSDIRKNRFRISYKEDYNMWKKTL